MPTKTVRCSSITLPCKCGLGPERLSGCGTAVVETAPSSVSGFRAPGGRGLASTFRLAGLGPGGNSDIQGGPSSETHAKRYGANPKTVAKWKARSSVSDLPTGPKQPRSTVLSAEEEAVVVAFRRHTLLPLDDCLYALQPTIPHLTRSSLHRCLQRHEISRLPQVEGEASAKRKFKAYPIGYFHIDIAEVRTAQGKLDLLVAIDERR